MDNRRKLLRLSAGDFLQVRSINEVAKVYAAKTKDFTSMGICFSSKMQWRSGEVLLIDYFIFQELEPVRLKLAVIWSELIGSEEGYFCGGEIIEIEKSKESLFTNYYLKRLAKEENI